MEAQLLACTRGSIELTPGDTQLLGHTASQPERPLFPRHRLGRSLPSPGASQSFPVLLEMVHSPQSGPGGGGRGEVVLGSRSSQGADVRERGGDERTNSAAVKSSNYFLYLGGFSHLHLKVSPMTELGAQGKATQPWGEGGFRRSGITSPRTFPRAPAVTCPTPAREGSPERPENSKLNCAPPIPEPHRRGFLPLPCT